MTAKPLTPIEGTKAIPGETSPPGPLVFSLAAKGSVGRDDVRRALALDPETRTRVMVAFGRQGGDLARWGATDRRRMASAITTSEDRLELRAQSSARRAVRDALKQVRRALEVGQ